MKCYIFVFFTALVYSGQLIESYKGSIMKTQHLNYQVDNNNFQGYVAWDDQISSKRPAILVFHDWSGCNDLAQDKARWLAEQGYVGFAVDMYGDGRVAESKEEKTQLMMPLKQDRNLLRRRALAALKTVSSLEIVDSNKLGAIGFCFGGLCALELARSGAEVGGVVTFHGLLDTQPGIPNHKILAKVLVLHGFDDPMVPPTQVLTFEEEMTQAGVDWEVSVYGHTMHAFTNPSANDPGFGTVYNPKAAKRAFLAMQNFFKEVFA